MNGKGLFLAVFASLLGGLLFLMNETQDDGLIDGLAPVDQLFFGFFLIFLTGVVFGGAAVLLIASYRAARGERGGDEA